MADAGGRDTEALTTALARGDERAFAEFYEVWFPRLYAKARVLTRRDESFCLDVVQEVMVKVATRIGALRDEDALATWLAKALVTTALDQLRGEARRRQREAGAGRDGAGAPPDIETQARLDWLTDRLAELPAEEHALLLARFGDGRTFAEVGTAYGFTGNAASGRIRRALERLRHLGRRWLHARDA